MSNLKPHRLVGQFYEHVWDHVFYYLVTSLRSFVGHFLSFEDKEAKDVKENIFLHVNDSIIYPNE